MLRIDFTWTSIYFQIALEEFKSICEMSEDKDVKPLMEILEENIHSLATTLPRTMRVAGKQVYHYKWIQNTLALKLT